MSGIFKCRIGCDIGGTFTDVVLLDEETGNVTLIKEPTTPRSPEVGATSSIRRAIRCAHICPKDIGYLCHATTVATNAIIGQAGLELPGIGFITTKGFRDLVEIGRQIRPNPYDFFTDKPGPLVPRYLRKEVSERIRFDGAVIKTLDEGEVRRIAKELKTEKVGSIAVCTLFSFLNPEHEKRICEIIQEEFPEVHVCLSHEVLPEFREYERASTTTINAALFGIIDRYLSSFEEKLREIGLTAELLLMQSSGRIMASEMARKKPVYIVESGPAAGAVAAAYMGKMMGYKNLVSFDMGGTTTKACLIEGGEPKVSTEFEVGGVVAAGRIVRGSGWPIKVPVIDLVEIGAGGGSIAWIDTGGALRVGPHSAGADPGPVCYKMGGTEPTITDAYVVLGVINPDFFIGGEMKIDAKMAMSSIKEKIADPLKMDVVEAASGIAEVANSNMTRAVKIVSVERGRDPRELVMIAFGGAGPMVAGHLMDELGFQGVIIPEAPGLFSAYGLLVSDIGHDYTLTRICKISEVNLDVLNREYQELEKKGVEDLKSERVSEDRILITRSADMRYVGQSYELNVSIPNRNITPKVMKEVEKRFQLAHETRYGYSAVNEPIEMVNLRVSAVGTMPLLKVEPQRETGESPNAAFKYFRDVYFKKNNNFVKCSVYDKYKLHYGNRIDGPAIIEQEDSTIVIQPGYTAKVDKYRQVVISLLQ